MNENTKNKLLYIFDVLDRNKIEALRVSFYGSGGILMEISNHTPSSIKMDYDENTIYSGLTLHDLILEESNDLWDKGADYANEGSVDFDVKKKSVTLCYDFVAESEITI